MARGRERGDVIDGQAVEITAPGRDVAAGPTTGRALPTVRRSGALSRPAGSTAVVKTAAAATAGGLAVGAVSVVLAKVVREAARPLPGISRRRKRDIQSSQSILIDVHMLKPRR